MKKLYVNQLFLFLIVAFLGVSCSEDEEVVDIRDQAVGSYSTTAEYEANNGEKGTIVGTMTISKHGSDNNMLIITLKDEEGDDVFYASKIAEATNGFTYDIAKQSFIDEEGDVYFIEGNGQVELGVSRYDGYFKTEEQEIKIGISTSYEDPQYSAYNYDMVITGHKK